MSSTILSHLLLLLLLLGGGGGGGAEAYTPKTQYCNFGHAKGEVDFCMGLSRTAARKIDSAHLSLSVRKSWGRGWTAIGTGESMTDSLMFIVYGDPEQSRAPVVSVRTAGGHQHPAVVGFESLGGAVQGQSQIKGGGGKVKVVSARWERISDGGDRKRHEGEEEDHDEEESTVGKEPKYAARVELVIEGRDWKPDGGAWIWAWNERQDFAESDKGFDVAARLHMHRHHQGSGGFGGFWVDAGKAEAASIEEVEGEMDWSSFEAKKENERVGSSDKAPGGRWYRKWTWPKAHGLFMVLGFLVMFPLGVVVMRMGGNGKKGTSSPFKRHWRVQMAATVLAVVGAVVGAAISKWRMPRTVHQWLGASIVLALLVQAVFGWRHHMVFLRIKKRTWLSYAHIWLGRVVIIAGLVNILFGMLLSGHGKPSVIFVGAIAALEVIGISYGVWRAQRRAQVEKQVAALALEVEGHALMPRGSSEARDYFAVEMSQDDSDDDDDDDEEALNKKSRGHDVKRSSDSRV